VKLAPTAVLSTTSRKKKKEAVKKKKFAGDKMDTDEKDNSGVAAEEDGSDEKEKDAVATTEKKKNDPEPTSEKISNPCRVIPAQEKFIRMMEPNTRYVPLKQGATSGILLLRDTTPGEPAELVTSDSPGTAAPVPADGVTNINASAAAEEPPPPEAFDYPMA
jgi:26S proteasome regulatory subunit N2